MAIPTPVNSQITDEIYNVDENRLLTTASLLSVLFMTLHLAGDIVRGMEKGGPSNLLAVPIFVVWLWGTLVLAHKKSGLVIMFLGSLFGAFVPVIHFRAPGGVASDKIVASGGAFFWIWTLIALGVTAVFAALLSARLLWTGFKRRNRPAG